MSIFFVVEQVRGYIFLSENRKLKAKGDGGMLTCSLLIERDAGYKQLRKYAKLSNPNISNISLFRTRIFDISTSTILILYNAIIKQLFSHKSFQFFGNKLISLETHVLIPVHQFYTKLVNFKNLPLQILSATSNEKRNIAQIQVFLLYKY